MSNRTATFIVPRLTEAFQIKLGTLTSQPMAVTGDGVESVAPPDDALAEWTMRQTGVEGVKRSSLKERAIWFGLDFYNWVQFRLGGSSSAAWAVFSPGGVDQVFIAERSFGDAVQHLMKDAGIMNWLRANSEGEIFMVTQLLHSKEYVKVDSTAKKIVAAFGGGGEISTEVLFKKMKAATGSASVKMDKNGKLPVMAYELHKLPKYVIPLIRAASKQQTSEEVVIGNVVDTTTMTTRKKDKKWELHNFEDWGFRLQDNLTIPESESVRESVNGSELTDEQKSYCYLGPQSKVQCTRHMLEGNRKLS